MRSDKPRLPKIGEPDVVRFTTARSRGARDLGMCGRRAPDGTMEVGCGKLFAPEQLGPAPAPPSLLRWDPRPRTRTGWRIGVPETKAMMLPDAEVRCCKACGGRVAPPPDPAIWKRSNEAWGTVTDPDLKKLMPRYLKKY